jgi:hypothetical protein
MQGIRGFVIHVDESRALDGTQAPNPVRWVDQSNEVRCVPSLMLPSTMLVLE